MQLPLPMAKMYATAQLANITGRTESVTPEVPYLSPKLNIRQIRQCFHYSLRRSERIGAFRQDISSFQSAASDWRREGMVWSELSSVRLFQKFLDFSGYLPGRLDNVNNTHLLLERIAVISSMTHSCVLRFFSSATTCASELRYKIKGGRARTLWK